jgi:hypothetical protein
MLDDRTDALFPLPHSPAGKLLSYLVARQIPGTPIDTTTAGVAQGAGLPAADAAAALAKLADDGLVLIEAGGGDASIITVLLAPPLDEYGIQPDWTKANSSVTGIPFGSTIPAAVTPVAPPVAAAAPGTGPAAPVERRPARGRRQGQHAAGQVGRDGHDREAEGGSPAGHAAAPASPAATTARSGAAIPIVAPPAGTGASAGATAAAATTPPPTSGRTSGAMGRPAAPAATTQPLLLPEAAEAAARGPVRRGGEPAGVDETALVRGFVDRFERLLAELDEWKRRAQGAEERVAATEKLLRGAERRAETAEARLAEAQERLRTWAELTRRMQQLSRQADGSRGRAPGSRSRPAATSADTSGADQPHPAAQPQ